MSYLRSPSLFMVKCGSVHDLSDAEVKAFNHFHALLFQALHMLAKTPEHLHLQGPMLPVTLTR